MQLGKTLKALRKEGYAIAKAHLEDPGLILIREPEPTPDATTGIATTVDATVTTAADDAADGTDPAPAAESEGGGGGGGGDDGAVVGGNGRGGGDAAPISADATETAAAEPPYVAYVVAHMQVHDKEGKRWPHAPVGTRGERCWSSRSKLF